MSAKDIVSDTAQLIYDAVEHGDLNPPVLTGLVNLIGSVDAFLNSPEELTLHFYKKLEVTRNHLKQFDL